MMAKNGDLLWYKVKTTTLYEKNPSIIPVECWVGYWFYKANQFYSDAFMEDSKINMIM